jgi:ATP-dependent Lhr-like helicase
VLDQMRQLGACFYQDLRSAVTTPSELELALSELVAAGRVTADSFSGMRGLLPSAKRKARPGRRARARPGAGLESAGRWTLIAAPKPRGEGEATPDGDVRAWAQLLLRRYGVVFRTLLEREHAPAWRDLLREYRRLEARGEVRGGRFVQRHAGEQFALPEAVPLLRSQRHAAARGDEVCLSACDPLNLLGTLLPGDRVAAAPHNSILFRDALPLAVRDGGETRFLEPLDEPETQRIAARLKRGPGPIAEPVLRALPDPRGRRSRAVA